MGVDTLETTEMARKMVKASITGSMGLSIRESGLTMKSQGTASINGQMVVSTWVTGSQTSWMTSEFTLGKMGVCTRVSTSRIRSMATVSTLGVTRNAMLVGGVKASNTVSASSSAKKVRRNWVSGRTARKSDGSLQRRRGT